MMMNSTLKIELQKISLNKECKQIVVHLFQQYQKIQDKLSLKIPYCTHFKIAKILNINSINSENTLIVEYYYDGLNGEQVKIVTQDSENQQVGMKNNFQLDQQDLLKAKSVFQCLIETFHWTANFGQFLDPYYENLYYDQQLDFFLLIPTFTLITKYLFLGKLEFTWEKFINFRLHPYQNATHILFCQFLDTFFKYLKEQDEDKQFYRKKFYDYRLKLNSIDEIFYLNEKYTGVDIIFGEDQIKKKSWRYSFKQTMILYQLDSNQKLRDLFLNRIKQDQQECLQAQKQLNSYQYNNLLAFLVSLNDIRSESHDVLTSFGLKIKQHLDSREEFRSYKNKVAAAFRPHYQCVQNNNKMINTALQQQDKQKIENNQNNFIHEFIWQSDINPQTILCQYFTQTNLRNGNYIQSSIKFGADVNQLILRYKFELIEQKNCYIINTVIPEIFYMKETEDDIMFLINLIQKEQGQTNLFLDDNKKLILHSSIIMGQKMEIIRSILKIIDIHQIYFSLILEFYIKNTAVRRLVKKSQYQQFVKELLQYVQDYEEDFENQMKNITSNNVQIGF